MGGLTANTRHLEGHRGLRLTLNGQHQGKPKGGGNYKARGRRREHPQSLLKQVSPLRGDLKIPALGRRPVVLNEATVIGGGPEPLGAAQAEGAEARTGRTARSLAP